MTTEKVDKQAYKEIILMISEGDLNSSLCHSWSENKGNFDRPERAAIYLNGFRAFVNAYLVFLVINLLGPVALTLFSNLTTQQLLWVSAACSAGPLLILFAVFVCIRPIFNRNYHLICSEFLKDYNELCAVLLLAPVTLANTSRDDLQREIPPGLERKRILQIFGLVPTEEEIPSFTTSDMPDPGEEIVLEPTPEATGDSDG